MQVLHTKTHGLALLRPVPAQLGLTLARPMWQPMLWAMVLPCGLSAARKPMPQLLTTTVRWQVPWPSRGPERTHTW